MQLGSPRVELTIDEAYFELKNQQEMTTLGLKTESR